jgi:hypothetical protein
MDDPNVTIPHLEMACRDQLMEEVGVTRCKDASPHKICDVFDEEDYKAFVCRYDSSCMQRVTQVTSHSTAD